MTTSTLFVAWGAIIPGREESAGAVLQQSMAFLSRLQQEGRIDGFEPVALAPHGGDLAGFVLVKGDRDAIAAVRGSEEYRRIMVQLQRVHQNTGEVEAFTGEELGRYFALWDEPLPA